MSTVNNSGRKATGVNAGRNGLSPTRREAVTVDANGFIVNDVGIQGVRNAMTPLMRLKADLAEGKIVREQIPDFVFDIKEYEDTRHFPANGEPCKIYVDTSTNRIYRWADDKYVELCDPSSYGYYVKPKDGIPASDMSEAVRILLGKAGTALQEHQKLADVFGEDSRLKEYILGDQYDRPLVPSKILQGSENPTIGEIANTLGWERENDAHEGNNETT